MSRLKGADLGAVSPDAMALHNRGVWSSTATYAVNDVVSNTYGLYSALVAVPSGSVNEPSLLPTYAGQGSGTSTTLTGTTSLGADSSYGSFTVNTTTTISSITVNFNAGSAGHFKVGIASSVGANPNATIFMSSVMASSPSVGNNTFTIPAVTLSPGTTYYIVFATTDSSSGGGASTLGCASTSTPTPTGNIVPGIVLGYSIGGSGSPAAWATQANLVLIFTLNAGAAPYWARIAKASNQEPVYVANSGTAVTLPDVDTDALHRITLTGNTTITLPTPAAGKSFTVVVVQDGTGSRTLAFATPSGIIKTAGGTAAATWSPTVTSTPGKEDVYTFLCTNVNWLGSIAGQNF